MGAVRIQRASSSDADDLFEVGAQTFAETFAHLYTAENLEMFLDEHHGVDKYHRILDDPSYAVWIARNDDGLAVAYAVAGPNDIPAQGAPKAAGEVKRLYVREEAQGLRLGSQLLELALRWLDENDYKPVYISVYSDNPGAQRLYRRYGFAKIGEYKYMVGQHADREFIFCDQPCKDQQ